MVIWKETPHTKGWWIGRRGGRIVGEIKHARRRQVGGRYRYKYQAVRRYAVRGGLPGTVGPIFDTLREAKAFFEKGAK